jgi:hypothetical protein
MAKGIALDSKHALRIGKVLLEAGAFHHVKHKHAFKNRCASFIPCLLPNATRQCLRMPLELALISWRLQEALLLPLEQSGQRGPHHGAAVAVAELPRQCRQFE